MSHGSCYSRLECFSEEESTPSDTEVIVHHSLKQVIICAFLQFLVKPLWQLRYYISAAVCAFFFLMNLRLDDVHRKERKKYN